MVVRKGLGINAVAFEVEDGDCEDRIDLAVDSLVGVPEDEGNVEGREVKLGGEETRREHSEKVAAGHANVSES